MRIFVTALTLAFVLASSAFAGNVALTGLGASATCGGTPAPCELNFGGTTYGASNTIDGNPATLWVAPGGTVNPYVLVDLGKLYTIDFVTISGVGNAARSIGFSVYAGTSSSVSTLLAGTAIGSTTQPGGTAWNDTYSVSTSSPIRYVLYNVTVSNTGSADTTHDDAYANTILADAVPEPGTVGLIGAGLLALGFTLRSRRK